MKKQYRYKIKSVWPGGLYKHDYRSKSEQAFAELGREFLLCLLAEQNAEEKFIDWEYWMEVAQTKDLLKAQKEADGQPVYVPTELSRLEEWGEGG